MYKESRMLMDTYCTITVVSSSKEHAREAINAGFTEIEKLEFLLNYFTDDSEVTAINQAAGKNAVKVNEETLEIINKTVNISKATEGAFDPSIAPVITLWKFSEKPPDPEIPAKKTIDDALKLVDYRKLKINDNTSEIYLSMKGMEIDLGGIAKGYAADKAVDAVMAKGIKAALVAVAGDIRGYGLNPSGQGWKVGIQNPRPETELEKPWEDIFAGLKLKDVAISTSGDYQRFFIKNGKRYHHIIDPETGYPAESDLISVSVIAREGYLADSLSTAVFVMGAEKGFKLLKEKGADGILVNKDKKIILTEKLKGKIEILNKEYKILN